MKKFICLILFCLILTGCHCGNFAISYKDNCTFWGMNILGLGTVYYDLIELGNEEKPFYKSDLKFSLKLPNGTILRSDELNLERIKEIEELKVENRKFQATTIYYYPASEFSAARFISFYFKGSNLSHITISDPAEFRDHSDEFIYIGAYDCSKFFKLPMTLEQIEEIFGKCDNVTYRWGI